MARAQVYQLTASGTVTDGSEYGLESIPNYNEFGGLNVNNAPFSTTETFYLPSPPSTTTTFLQDNSATAGVTLTVNGNTASFSPGNPSDYASITISNFDTSLATPGSTQLNGVSSTILLGNSGLSDFLIIQSPAANAVPPNSPLPPTQLGPVTVGTSTQGPYSYTPVVAIIANNPQVVVDGLITQFSINQVPIWTNQDASTCINWYTCNGSSTVTGSGNVTTGDITIGNGGNGGSLGVIGNTLTTGALTIGGTSYGSASITATEPANPATLNASSLTVGAAAGGSLSISGTLPSSGAYIPASATIAGPITLGSQSSAWGSMTLYSSSLASGGMVVGDAGSGYFTNYSGNQTVNGDLVLANQAYANGQYTMAYDPQSGNTTTLGVTGNLVVGNAGSGYFEADYGQATVGGNLSVGGQYSSYYQFNGSAVTVAGNATVGGTGAWVQLGGASTFGVTGNLTVGGMYSTWYQTGGTITVGGNATVGGPGTVVRAQLTGNAAFNTTGNLTIAADPSSSTVFATSLHAGDSTSLGVGGNFTVGDTELVAFAQGGGTTTVGKALTIGNQSGSQGLATIGGQSTVTAGSLEIGSQGGSYGELDLNIYQGDAAGMTVNGNATVGDAGVGVLNAIGGTATIKGNLVVGNAAGGTGSVGLGGPASFGLSNFTGSSAAWQNGGAILSAGGGASPSPGTSRSVRWRVRPAPSI